MSVSTRQFIIYPSPSYHYHRLTDNVGMLIVNSLNNFRYINHLYYTDSTLVELHPASLWVDKLKNEEIFNTLLILIKNKDKLVDKLSLTDTNIINPKQCMEILIKYLNKRGCDERTNI